MTMARSKVCGPETLSNSGWCCRPPAIMRGKPITAMVGCTEPTVVTWRRRYSESGRSGGSAAAELTVVAADVLRHQVLELTLTEPLVQ
jgi:hypothetical protein